MINTQRSIAQYATTDETTTILGTGITLRLGRLEKWEQTKLIEKASQKSIVYNHDWSKLVADEISKTKFSRIATADSIVSHPRNVDIARFEKYFQAQAEFFRRDPITIQRRCEPLFHYNTRDLSLIINSSLFESFFNLFSNNVIDFLWETFKMFPLIHNIPELLALFLSIICGMNSLFQLFFPDYSLKSIGQKRLYNLFYKTITKIQRPRFFHLKDTYELFFRDITKISNILKK